MTWIKRPSFWLSVAIICCLIFSWQFKIFGFLFLALFFSCVFVGINFQKVATQVTLVSPVIFTLMVIEFALPFISTEDPAYYDPNSGYGNGYYNRIAGFGFLLNPGFYTSRKLSSSGEVIYDVSYTIGDDGFRANDFPSAPNVNLYGGSFVFGEGLNDNETLSAFLWNDFGIATKNYGIHAYGLHQALYMIETQGLSATNGVNLTLTAPWHALRSSCKPLYAIGTPFYQVDNGFAVLRGVCSGGSFLSRVLRRSEIYQLIANIFSAEAIITDADIHRYLAIIRSIQRETQRSNSRLVVGYIDTEENRLRKTSYTNQTLIESISEIADVVVDVTLADTRENLSAKYYVHELDQHPSALANRERAKILAQFLR